MSIATWEFESPPLHMRNFRANRVQKNAFLCRGAAENLDCRRQAEIAQLVEHNLAKVGVAGPSPVFRSKHSETAGVEVRKAINFYDLPRWRNW